MSVSVEIIDFYRPVSNSKNLYISGIFTNELNEAQITAVLYESCCPFGLLHEVQVFPGVKITKATSKLKVKEDSMSYYAFVKFYSYHDAQKARVWLCKNLTVGSQPCKVSFATRTKVTDAGHILYAGRCQELANFYLGFNGWTTAILRLQEDKESEGTSLMGPHGEGHSLTGPLPQPLQAGVRRVRFFCLLELSFPRQGLSTQGFGAWEETYAAQDPSSKATAILKARKRSLQRALEEAFSRCLLVAVGGRKVSVEIDTTRCDPLSHPHLAALTHEEGLQVTELEAEPQCPEEGTTPDPHTTHATDDVNLHILQELEDN
ncbi:hypothetical protein V1264_009660 [Littorina saxatilis]|uniref:RRM domain-containing protein n=2 Tax=Littorina saxatilis TaxID=31220 RepID=A0AAN9ARW6_9CAEN